jgi:hypothetical protein
LTCLTRQFALHIRNELGSVAAIRAEYRNHDKAGLSTREPSDLLLAKSRALVRPA